MCEGLSDIPLISEVSTSVGTFCFLGLVGLPVETRGAKRLGVIRAHSIDYLTSWSMWLWCWVFKSVMV